MKVYTCGRCGRTYAHDRGYRHAVYECVLRVVVGAMAFGVLILLAANLHAQTILSVPYGSAKIVWDVPSDPPMEGYGLTRRHIVNCGAQDVLVEMPAVSVALKDLLPGPGSYTCTVRAANDFGVSEAASSPAFQTGYGPGKPGNLRLEVR